MDSPMKVSYLFDPMQLVRTLNILVGVADAQQI